MTPKPVRAMSRKEMLAHYKLRVLCISMKEEDVAFMDDLVDELRARGLRTANRSALIRAALAQVDLDTLYRKPPRSP